MFYWAFLVRSVVIFMKEFSIFIFFDWGLYFIKCLFNKLSVLDVEDTIGIAFNLWVMGYHDTSSGSLFTFSLWSNSVDIQD